jgi:Tfp pilus assembly protein PilO
MSIRPATSWREHLAAPLTWHYAGFILLLLLVIGLGVRFAFDWAAISGRSTDAVQSKQYQLKAMDLETAPLRGLDKRVDETRDQIKGFYSKRIPPNYSAIGTRIGELAIKAGVRLSRVNYTQGLPGSDITEISMDAGISGAYPQIMRFVNSLERDQTFFVVRAMSLTGQQGGLVNLRLRVSTWLRPADVPNGLAPTPPAGDGSSPSPSAQASPQTSPGKEGL